MKRIIILGGTGVGKTTLAREISEILKIPFYSLDFMVFDKNWKKRPLPKREDLLKRAIKKNKWVMEGRYADDWVLPALKKVELIIILDFRKRVLFGRVFKRFKQSVKEKSAYGTFGSLVACLKFANNYRLDRYLKFEEFSKKNNGEFIILRTDEAVENFLKDLKTS